MCLRGRNKLYRSTDDFRPVSIPTFSDDSQEHRWSEVVPPKTALTFAALWDPDEGMVTFSGAALLESETCTGMAPHSDVFNADCSQIMSLDRNISATADNTTNLAAFQDAFKAFLHRVPRNSRQSFQSKTVAAHQRLDCSYVHPRDCTLKPRSSLQFSNCDKAADVESSSHASLAARGIRRFRSDIVHDRRASEIESSSSARHMHLKSRFSTTTTSTSNYIEVPHTRNIPPLPPVTPVTPQQQQQPAYPPTSPTSSPRRLLRKKRPPPVSLPSISSPEHTRSPTRGSPLFASPASPSPTSPSKSGKHRFSILSRRMTRGSSDEGWVCIEVTPIIKQRYVASLDDDQ
ncbi:hypothetical protein F5I97DRAFT_463673 [Phlebopus sp. FC_14]|nr:hypothetical protein F5I97DRAFT_463673 [Phlebopus sp. FC_14]